MSAMKIPRLLKGRSSRDVLLALIKHYTDLDLPKTTKFGTVKFLDPLPQDKLDEDTFIPFVVPRGTDNRLLGQTGAMYRRYPLQELGTIKLLTDVTYPLTTERLIQLLNQEHGLLLDHTHFVQTVFADASVNISLTATKTSPLFSGSTAVSRKRIMFPVFLLQAFQPAPSLLAF